MPKLKGKRITFEEAERVLFKMIHECEADTFCAIMDDALGTTSVVNPEDDESIIVEAGEFYGGAFGKI